MKTMITLKRLAALLVLVLLIPPALALTKLGEYNAKDRFSTLVQTIEELIIDHQTASNIKSSSSTLKT